MKKTPFSPKFPKSYLMNLNVFNRVSLLALLLLINLLSSCSNESDLFDEYVLQEEEIEEPIVDENPNSGDESEPDDAPSNDISAFSDFVESTPNKIVGTFNPTSAAEISDPSKANYKAIIDASFACDNCTFAENLTIEPSGGAITGKNINLNGAFILNNFKKGFTPNTSFSEIYSKTRLSPETFGANGGDNASDDDSLSGLIANVAYAVGKPSSIYVKNKETVHSRSGLFDFEMGGATVQTTNAASLSHGTDISNQKTYLFEFSNMNVRFFNGSFDGQNLASRLFRLNGIASYLFDNVQMFDYYAPPNAYARGIALSIEVKDNFKGGKLMNSSIRNIGAASDNNANNAPFGVSKAISLSVASQNRSEQLIEGCTIENIYGDDAEGFMNRPAFGYGKYNYGTNEANVTFNNNIIKGCQRRAFKINASNVQITNNVIESARNDWTFSGAQVTNIGIFSIKSGQPVRNVNVTGNTIKTLGDARNSGLAINDATDCLIENNSFEANYPMLQRNITFGVRSNQGGLYDGDLSNTVIFRKNDITNFFFNLNVLYRPINGGFIFEDNVVSLDIDRNLGGFWATFRIASNSGDTAPHTFKNLTININQTLSSGTFFGGVILSQGRNLKNLVFDNVNINYSGTSLPTYPFASAGTGETPANFDNSNLIRNSKLTGASGTGSINVTGSNTSVVIENSTGDRGTPLTTN